MSCKYMKKINKLSKKLSNNPYYQGLNDKEKSKYFDEEFKKMEQK